MNPFNAAPVGVLELNLSFHFLQWIAYFITPKVMINGYLDRRSWGVHRIQLAPGQHHVRVSFPYLFNDDCGPAEAMVPIYPGMLTRVDYQIPFLVFMNGTMNVYGPYQLPPS